MRVDVGPQVYAGASAEVKRKEWTKLRKTSGSTAPTAGILATLEIGNLKTWDEPSNESGMLPARHVELSTHNRARKEDKGGAGCPRRATVWLVQTERGLKVWNHGLGNQA